MAVLEALSDEESYLIALLMDPSGVDIAEFLWRDPDQRDNLFRCYPYQYPWYRNDAKKQIDQCVAEGTLVLTARGYLPIEKVAVGDQVWTHEERWREVTHTWDRGEQDVVLVKGAGHHGIRVTTDHKFWREDGTFAPLMVGARWGSPMRVLPPAPAEVPAMTPAYRSGRQNCVRDTTQSDFLWLYGLYLAEGSISSSFGTGGPLNRVTFSVHTNEARHVQDRLEGVGLRYNSQPVGTEQCVNIVVNSQPLADWMLVEGGRRAAGKRLALWVHGLEEKDRAAVFNGYLYGDGWTGTGKQGEARLSFSTASKALAYGMKHLAASIGWYGGTHLRQRASVTIDGRDVTGRESYVTDLRRDRRRAGWPQRNNHAWGLVRSIEPAGRARVYDLEIEGDHSFVIEGLVVSNCARAIGKSVGIQMRAFAFPFCNPGNEMLITAPEMIHLDPVTKNIEDRLMSTRLSREMLKSGNQSNGITHRPFEAKFRNNAKIIGRIPQKDGKGVKGSAAAGALVTTPIGHLPIEKISRGDLVLTGEGRFLPVEHVFSYEANTVSVAGAGHRGLQVSENHRFYARRNRNPQRTRNLDHPTWMPVDDDEYGRHYWASPATLPPVPLPNLPFDFADITSLFWLIGCYVADGHLGGSSAGVSLPSHIAFTADRSRIELIESIAQLAGFDPKRRPHDNAACTVVNRSALARFLLLEFGQHADGKRIPIWMHTVPRYLQDTFLEGYLTGDGHRDDTKSRWTASTASKELAIGLRLLGNQMGFTTGFSWVDVKPNSMCASPLRSYRVTLSDRDQGIRDDRFVWQKIRSITPSGPAIVYDLIIAEDASYVADGLVHRGGLI